MSQGDSDQGPMRNWGCVAGTLFVVLTALVLLLPAGYAVWWMFHEGLW